MRAGTFGKRVAVLGVLVIGAHFGTHAAEAARYASGHYHARAIHSGMMAARYSMASHWTRYARGGRLQCVPFARENTGIELSGNAANWWAAADGVYERGSRPEVGSILNFRATRRMRMGHVAVVSNVIDSRNVEIDQANWGGPGSITRNVTVVDVSPANDWSQVRVELGHTGGYGSVYPTYGFIYDRPDRGTMLANSGVTPGAPAAALETAAASEDEEVAEADDDTAPRASRRHYARHARFFGHASVYRVRSHYGFERHVGRRHRT